MEMMASNAWEATEEALRSDVEEARRSPAEAPPAEVDWTWEAA